MKDIVTGDKDQNLPMVSIIIMIRISSDGISLNPLHTQDDYKIYWDRILPMVSMVSIISHHK